MGKRVDPPTPTPRHNWQVWSDTKAILTAYPEDDQRFADDLRRDTKRDEVVEERRRVRNGNQTTSHSDLDGSGMQGTA